MLDTSFARPHGDAGNPHSWPFPVVIERVAGALARPVVEGAFTDIDLFIAAGQRLVDQGARAIVTTCGFLARFQHELSQALPVPVMTSTLIHYQRLAQAQPVHRCVAILTIDAAAFDSRLRTLTGVPHDALIFSLPPNSHFVSAILNASEPLDSIRASQEWVELALDSQLRHPEIAQWLFECANMPPYASAVSRTTGLPVYDTIKMGCELHAKTCC